MCWSTRTLYSCSHLRSYASGGCDRYLTGTCKLKNWVAKLALRCRDCEVSEDLVRGRRGVEKGKKGKGMGKGMGGWLRKSRE